MNNAIEIQDTTKRYPDFVLDNINLEIPYGKIVGLIGENGAGKTTLISLILNQRNRDNGTIKIFGLNNIKDEKKIKADIGFVVDECCFHDCLSPKNIGSIMKPIYPQWNNSYFNELLSVFGLSGTKKISELSKGMKGKLMLATALSHNPRLLILDEVTSGLDPVVRDDILQILKDFVKDGSKSVFFSTHITSDLDKIADYVAFLHKGNLVFIEECGQLKCGLLLLECSAEEYNTINKEKVVAYYLDDKANKYTLLFRHSLEIEQTYVKCKTPTIDDIMLIYIKGVKKS